MKTLCVALDPKAAPVLGEDVAYYQCCFLVPEKLKTALIQNVGKIDCLHYFDFFRNELMR